MLKIFDFNIINKDYDDALTSSGHDRHRLYSHDKSNLNSNNKKIRKPRKIIYFSPPFCNSVKTKIGLEIVRLQVPKNNKFHRIFNKNTIKISYSCLPNMRNISSSHNKKILEAENKTKRTCNFRNKTNCPFNGECLLKGVHKAKVREKENIGSMGTSFKTRLQQHKQSILKKLQKTARAKFTELNNFEFIEIKWQILF